MPTFTIYNRFTRAPIYSASAGDRRNFLAAVPLGTDLTAADLKGEDVSNLNWSGMNLTNADLTEANCNGTKFHGANLTNVNLTRANLDRTNFQTATVTAMTTTNAKQRGAKGI